MLVKICGITRADDAAAAVAAGAGAIGFILWPGSPRHIPPDRAHDIAQELPDTVMKVGVFVDQPAAVIEAAARRIGLTHVQLHGRETPPVAAQLSLPVIKATSLAADEDALDEWPDSVLLLVDAHDPVRHGGTGELADWPRARALSRRRRVVLAGGLTPENVAAAVEQVAPYGIDVSSGVESAPGIKDISRIEALFGALRKAGTRS
jgi:phosphoribosylanthranilate isomerase